MMDVLLREIFSSPNKDFTASDINKMVGVIRKHFNDLPATKFVEDLEKIDGSEQFRLFSVRLSRVVRLGLQEQDPVKVHVVQSNELYTIRRIKDSVVEYWSDECNWTVDKERRNTYATMQEAQKRMHEIEG